MNITLRHSPYLRKTTFELPANVKKTKDMEKIERLNANIWELSDYFERIIDDMNQKVRFCFKGRQEDYDVFVNMLINLKNKKKYGDRLSWKQVNSDVLELHTIQNKMVTLIKQIQQDDILNNLDIDIPNMFKTLAIPTEIAVVANMSAGKSTLINALMGHTLLPSKSPVCTSLVTKIEHNNNIKKPQYCNNGHWENLDDLKIIKQLHKDASIDHNEIHLKYNFNKGMSSQFFRSFMIVDTPGTNSSEHTEHRDITYKYILGDNNTGLNMRPIVMLIFNIASGSCTNDNKAMLDYIKEKMNNSEVNILDSFIFILNKAELDSEEDLIENIKNIKHTLKKDHSIENPKIFPVSALNALTIKEGLKKNKIDYLIKTLTSTENEEGLVNLSQYATLPQHQKDVLNKRLSSPSISDEEKVLIYSGLPAIEVYLNDYMEKYDLPIKLANIHSNLKTIIDGAFNTLTQVKPLVKNGKYSLAKEAEYKKKLEKLKSKLDNARIIEKIEQEIQELQSRKLIDGLVNNISEEIKIGEQTFVSIGNEVDGLNQKKIEFMNQSQIDTKSSEFLDQSTIDLKSEKLIENFKTEYDDFYEKLHNTCLDAVKDVSDWMSHYQNEAFIKANKALKNLFGEKDYEKFNIGQTFVLEMDNQIDKTILPSKDGFIYFKPQDISVKRDGLIGWVLDKFSEKHQSHKYPLLSKNLIAKQIGIITAQAQAIERTTRDGLLEYVDDFKQGLISKIQNNLQEIHARSLDFDEMKKILESKEEIELYKEELNNILKGV